MDQAATEELIRRVFHEGTGVPNPPAELRELFRTDFICHGPPGMNHSHDDGPEPIERCIFSGAFDDLVFTVEGVDVEDDRVASRFTATGTHAREFMGVPPTGEPRTVTGTATFRLKEGQLAEGWGTLAWD